MASSSAAHASSSRWIQRGLARLTASFNKSSNKTLLTNVSHQSPLRLLPIPSSSIQQAGAAVCALSSYGGGMLPGDVHSIEINVQDRATCGVITQGPQRIYKRRSKNRAEELQLLITDAESRIEATVGRDALLVFAIDPCVPFQHSSFQQSLNISLESSTLSSCILVDWFAAGRLSRGEFWNFDSLKSKTSLYKQGEEFPFLVESMHLDNTLTRGKDPFGFQRKWNAYCSVILHGPQAEPVARRLQQLSLQLTSEYTRVRDYNNNDGDDDDMNDGIVEPPRTSGRVLIGVNEVIAQQHDNDDESTTFVARLATTCNEDLYRILHAALQPLAPQFGMEFYRDRIHSSQTASPTTKNVYTTIMEVETTSGSTVAADDKESTIPTAPPLHNDTILNSRAFWNAYMLADSGLPTGSFAHSAGMEAAAQLHLVNNSDDDGSLEHFVHAAIRSSLQLQVPFVNKSQSCIYSGDDWIRVNQQLHAYLVSNSVACRASLEQGQGLLRVALVWLQAQQEQNKNNDNEDTTTYIALLKEIQELVATDKQEGHLAPIFAIVCSALGLSSKESCQLLGYCTARDMVSAAVRLNLIGPMAGVVLLDSCWNAVDEGISSAEAAAMNDDAESDLIQASTCAPIVETIHPCHEILSVRLFRT